MSYFVGAGVDTMTTDVRLRPLEEGDVPAGTALCDQLGYPNSERDVRRRIRDLAGSADDAVSVAVLDGHQRLGFRVFKTQYAFEKEVSGRETTAGS
jgi:hypothetical protein